MTASAVGWIPSSRHRLGPFALHRPTTVDEADALLGDLDGAVHLLAGGMDLLNALKDGAPCHHLIDLARIDALRGVRRVADAMEIGALVTHREVERSTELELCFPGIASIWAGLGNVRVRNAGTLVGNVVAGVARYDVHPVLACLDAEIVGDDGAAIPVRETTPDGLLTSIRIPIPPRGAVGLHRELKPMLSCAVSLREERDGWRVGVAFGCVPPGRAVTVDVGSRSVDEIVREVGDITAAVELRDVDLPADAHASERYRRRIAPGLVRRQLLDVARRVQRQGDDHDR